MQPTESLILASFIMYDQYGKYKMFIKPFDNEKHMSNYIEYMQKNGSKFISTKVLVNE